MTFFPSAHKICYALGVLHVGNGLHPGAPQGVKATEQGALPGVNAKAFLRVKATPLQGVKPTIQGTSESQSHNTRSTTQRSSHRTTPRTSRAGRIQKNTRSNHTRRQVSQSLQHNLPLTETNSSSRQSGEDEASEYRSTPPNNSQHDTPELHDSSTPPLSETSVTLCAEDITQETQSRPKPTLRLNAIRELLHSHEADIVNRVVHQLNSQNPNSSWHNQVSTTPQPPLRNCVMTDKPRNLTSHWITELENQLAQLRAEQELKEVRRDGRGDKPATLGTYNPLHPTVQETGEGASSITESVGILFHGVERRTFVQIIENRFKPTNIYRLLLTEKEPVESQRMINIGGIEFEQTERDDKESESKISGFFKVWASYSGILVKLASQALQGELATALFIYTMNLYDLLEKYTWDRVKPYHFQVYRKQVASGKGIYYLSEWLHIDSELIASRCFAHLHIPRSQWTSSPNRIASFPRRSYSLPIRETHFSTAPPHTGNMLSPFPASSERQTNTYHTGHSTSTATQAGNRSLPITTQVCRNWNYRECRSAYCCNQHICINCGSNHKASQCTQRNTALTHSAHMAHHTQLHATHIVKKTIPTTYYLSPTCPVVSKLPARPNTILHYSLFTPHSTTMPAGQLPHLEWRRLT